MPLRPGALLACKCKSMQRRHGVVIEVVQAESADANEVVLRFWCHRDHSYTLDDFGYLADPQAAGFLGASRNPEAITAEHFHAIRCLVLLGEPGIGKTVEVQRHAPFAEPASCEHALTVDLGEYSSEERLIREIFDSDTANQWLQSGATCCITMDGFDEAHSRIPTLPRILARYLKSWPRDRLQVRIACRTAEWPTSLESDLTELFEDVAVYELLPLRRVDVPRLLHEGVDSNAFLEAVDRAGAAPLAARPLTLRFLESVFSTKGELSENAADLFSLGVNSLCSEVNLGRVDARLDRHLDRWAAPADCGSAGCHFGIREQGVLQNDWNRQ